MAQWFSMPSHNTGVVGSIHPCVTFKAPLVRKATGNHLVNSSSLEEIQSPVSGFCYARNRVCEAVVLEVLVAYTKLNDGKKKKVKGQEEREISIA